MRDAFSRFILCIQLVDRPSVEEVQPIFLELFKRYGVPRAIQCDNGSPFISMIARGGTALTFLLDATNFYATRLKTAQSSCWLA